MNVACFYHCWAAGAWQEPTIEHIGALEASGFDGPVFLGIVGAEAERKRVMWLWEELGRPATVVATASSGHEPHTINALRGYSMENGGAVLYAHTKGAGERTEFRAKWRRAMTLRVVSAWRENLGLLEDGAQAVGCHWLTPARHSAWRFDRPCFGGNFWMARCDYLRTLRPCPRRPRFEAEAWIGTGNPRIVDLAPGFPTILRWPEQVGNLAAGAVAM